MGEAATSQIPDVLVVGGGINAKLHPMPDFKMDKDGKITPIVEVKSGGGGHGEHGEGAPSLFLAIDPPRRSTQAVPAASPDLINDCLNG